MLRFNILSAHHICEPEYKPFYCDTAESSVVQHHTHDVCTRTCVFCNQCIIWPKTNFFVLPKNIIFSFLGIKLGREQNDQNKNDVRPTKLTIDASRRKKERQKEREPTIDVVIFRITAYYSINGEWFYERQLYCRIRNVKYEIQMMEDSLHCRFE